MNKWKHSKTMYNSIIHFICNAFTWFSKSINLFLITFYYGNLLLTHYHCVKSVHIRSFSDPNVGKYEPEKPWVWTLFIQWISFSYRMMPIKATVTETRTKEKLYRYYQSLKIKDFPLAINRLILPLIQKCNFSYYINNGSFSITIWCGNYIDLSTLLIHFLDYFFYIFQDFKWPPLSAR